MFIHTCCYQTINLELVSVITKTQMCLAQLAGAVEYTNCISAVGKTPLTPQ